jgi:hypothetical protein
MSLLKLSKVFIQFSGRVVVLDHFELTSDSVGLVFRISFTTGSFPKVIDYERKR